MSREWQPGDVAMVPGVGRAFFRHGCWVTTSSVDGLSAFMDVRPLVVIDPEDREQVERLMLALWGADRDLFGKRRVDDWTPLLQTALRSLIVPVKPEEPQRFAAVVEDSAGRMWVRTTTDVGESDEETPFAVWRAADSLTGTRPKSYHEIAAVKVLSPGVTA